MNEVQIFNYKDKEVRTIEKNGEPWWVLRDVCGVLDLAKADRVSSRLDEDEKDTHLVSTHGGKQKMTIINESGLYSVILRSDRPEAKPFRKWITSEVLPMIRKTGIYSTSVSLIDGDSVTPMRTLTPDDYISAARLIATCKNDRLKIIINLLAKGGWDIGAENERFVSGTSTADIEPRIRTAMSEHKLTFAELSAKTGISAEVLRSYRDGRRFPKPERYVALVGILETL